MGCHFRDKVTEKLWLLFWAHSLSLSFSASLPLHLSLRTLTLEKASCLVGGPPPPLAHRTIKDKVTPVSRSSEKPHEGQIFRFCLTSPVELEWKGLRADMYWSNEIRNA